MASSEPAPATARFDGVENVERIRTGPIAELYRGVQPAIGRPVLVKALAPGVLPSSPFAATLEREARLLAELRHDGILQLYDFVQREDRAWLVLEAADGWSVADLLEKAGPLEPAAAAAIALGVARVLDHVHARGVVHRNLRPEHVLLTRTGAVKVTDFAVASDERLPTAPELLDGPASFTSPAYLSPEQILGEAPDPRSDLFSLGVVLYEMLSGQRPFDAPDMRAVTQRIRHDPAPPLPRGEEVPGALERVLHRCLQKLPSDRFASAAELGQALEAVLSESGITASTAIGRALHRARLGPAPAEPAPARPAADRRRALSLGRVVRGLLVFSLLVVAGGGALRLLGPGRGSAEAGRTHGLRLVPARPGHLRVVAEPWAHVYIDGEHVETTPFARPIPLPAGTHYVRLEHPNAPAERRTLEIAAGESVLLDVKMKVSRAAASIAPARPPPDAAADAPPASP
jgi:serine/threonine-protein kinase